ncbi:MAG TPA: hypothetical protein VHE99_00030 [Gammaproteobacteria bacterium]|nr:hypothetical protein [Gammaproteobacteria bacterium]
MNQKNSDANNFILEIDIRKHEVDPFNGKIKPATAANIFQHAIFAFLHLNYNIPKEINKVNLQTFSCSFSFYFVNLSINDIILVSVSEKKLENDKIEFHGEARIKDSDKKIFSCHQTSCLIESR